MSFFKGLEEFFCLLSSFFKKSVKKDNAVEQIPEITKQIETLSSELGTLSNLVKSGFAETQTSIKDTYQHMDAMEKAHNKVEASLRELSDRMGLIQKGMQKELFYTLKTLRREYILRGWADTNEKNEFIEIYKVYHSMGENGWIDSYYDQVINLPESEEEWRMKKCL